MVSGSAGVLVYFFLGGMTNRSSGESSINTKKQKKGQWLLHAATVFSLFLTAAISKLVIQSCY